MKISSSDYQALFSKLKQEINAARQKTYQTVNKQLVELYCSIGRSIYEKIAIVQWGEGIVEKLAKDLQKTFPDMKGFSSRNLWEMKKIYETYKDQEKLQPLVAELSWSHNLIILHHAQTEDYAVDLLFYHRILKCFVAVELKIGKFKPEYIGKMQFYLSALDEKVKLADENPSVGIILCKSKNDEVIRIALNKALSPMKIATYKTKLIDPELLKQKLHSLPAPDAEGILNN